LKNSVTLTKERKMNNDTVLEVMKLGFKAKYGVDMVGGDS